jgi:hypothetical protein
MNYNFSVVNGTYTPLVNKTVFQSGTQLNTDATSGSITLPFAFSMYGEQITTAYLCNNGFVGFGSAPNRNNIYNAISSSETMAKYLISFSNQITAWNGEGSQPEISYGQNANNDMVFQFQDIGITTDLNVRFTFQIILKSDGTTVEIMFGANCIGGQTGRSFECGLRGLQQAPSWNPTAVFKNTVAGGYHNRLLITGNWNTLSNVKAGTQPSSAMNTKATNTMPNSGLTYKWIAN